MSHPMPGQQIPGEYSVYDQQAPPGYNPYGMPPGPGVPPYQQAYGQAAGQFPYGPGVAPGPYPYPNPYGQDPYQQNPYQTQPGPHGQAKPWLVPLGIVGIVLGVILIIVALSDPTQSGRLMFRGLIPLISGIGLLIRARRK